MCTVYGYYGIEYRQWKFGTDDGFVYFRFGLFVVPTRLQGTSLGIIAAYALQKVQ